MANPQILAALTDLEGGYRELSEASKGPPQYQARSPGLGGRVDQIVWESRTTIRRAGRTGGAKASVEVIRLAAEHVQDKPLPISMVDSRNEPLRAQDRRALIVEDAPGMRSYIRAILDAVGFECLEASDGVDALGFASDGRIDLIITDIEMPRMNGLDFLKSVHEGAFGPNPPPAIVCSGHLDDATYALRPELKMCAARLTKPFRPIDLMVAVAAAVTPTSSAV